MVVNDRVEFKKQNYGGLTCLGQRCDYFPSDPMI